MKFFNVFNLLKLTTMSTLERLMKRDLDSMRGGNDLVGILYESGFANLKINLADAAYQGLSIREQFEVACAACFRVSKTCECVGALVGVTLDHLEFINNNPSAKFSNLKRIQFAVGFNQPIADVIWPSTLETILFWDDFNQPIADVVWPPNIRTLMFGEAFDAAVIENNVNWPPSLERIHKADNFYAQQGIDYSRDETNPAVFKQLPIAPTIIY